MKNLQIVENSNEQKLHNYSNNKVLEFLKTNMMNNDYGSKFRNSIITTNQIYRFEKLFYNSIKDGDVF